MARINMERLGEMEVFARVVSEGGFSAAGRSLDLTPSAVSKIVARLEARLGNRLLNRTTRAITLTSDGEAYHRAVLQILRETDDAEAAAMTGAARGRLTVTASIPFGAMYVAPAVLTFMADNPGLEVELSLSDGIVDIVSQRVDVAVRMGELPDSGLVARKLGASRRVVCASPDYLSRRSVPQVPSDLAAHDCLTFAFRRSRPVWPFMKDGRDGSVAVSGKLSLNDGETMKRMAIAGAGIARVGLFHVAREIQEGSLVTLLEDWNPGDVETVHAMFVGGAHIPNRVRRFVDHLTRSLEAIPHLQR